MTKLADDLPATTQLAAVKLTLKGQQGLIMKINVGNSIWIANEGESEIILEEGALLSAIIGCVLGVCILGICVCVSIACQVRVNCVSIAFQLLAFQLRFNCVLRL